MYPYLIFLSILAVVNDYLLSAILRLFQNLLHLIKLRMNSRLIYAALAEISLYLDQSILEEIKRFFDTFIRDLSQPNTKLSIYVCTAIVCQCKKVPAIQSPLNVPFGINVEKLLKFCPEPNKEQFIKTILSVIQKWPTCPVQFHHKLQFLKLSYRTFKKYKLACRAIGEKFQINILTNQLISSLFWLIYIIVKHLNNDSDSIEIMTQVVPYFIYQVYYTHVQTGHPQILLQIISKFFSQPNSSNEQTKQIHERYSKQCIKILHDSYSRRYLTTINKFSSVVQKPAVLERLIDDLSNQYGKALAQSPQFSIDQMSFLELMKDMTPEGFHQKIDKSSVIISEKISFDGEKLNSQQICTPKRPPLFKLNRQVQDTPLTARMQNLKWIRSCIQNLSEEQLKNIQSYFNQYQSGFAQFWKKSEVILQKVIHQFSPSNRDTKRRQHQIYKFFAYCIQVAIKLYGNDIKKIFETPGAIFSIFCLCTEIFNFVYQAYNGNYSRYCQLFEIDLVNAFWPINWIGYYIKMPKSVDDHLFELEKRFLLRDIWNSNLGFEIITNNDKIIKVNDYRMQQRLRFHIKLRINEICKEIITEKMMQKVFNLVIYLIDQKSHLLKRNNIDQMIICSITAALSINQVQNSPTIQNILSCYEKSAYSNLQNKEKTFDNEGNQVNIIDFYNRVFLSEIEESLNNHPQSQSFLLTPKRLQLGYKLKGQENSPSFMQKYKVMQTDFSKSQKGKYQFILAQNIKNDQMEEQEQDGGDGASEEDQKVDKGQMKDEGPEKN